MSVIKVFNSTSYTLPTTGETGWATQVTNFQSDLADNALDKASTQTVPGDKTFTGIVDLSGATVTYGATTITGNLDWTGDASGNIILDSGDTLTSASGSTITIAAGSTIDVSAGTFTVGANQISGNAIDGGTISDFASTGIDDNAASTAITIASGGGLTLAVDLDVTEGGTGSSTAGGARTNLGIVIGTDVQAFGAVLDDFNTLGASASDGQFIVATGVGAFAYESGTTVRTSLGLTIGTDVQAYDADTSKLDVAETRSASLNLADNELIRPKIKDYGETVNAIGATGGGTQDINLTLGNVVSATVNSSANTFTFSNPPATGTAGSFTLILTNGGSQTVNWPSTVDWAGETAPTLTAAGVDILTFLTTDAGVLWHGFAASLDSS